MKRLTAEQLDNLDNIKFKMGARGILLDNIPELILMAKESLLLRETIESNAHNGCLTGDCPHTTQKECWEVVEKIGEELRVALFEVNKLWGES